MPPYPEEPDYYSEPTQAAKYGGYYDSGPEPEPPTPWHRRPAALIAAGALGAIVLAAVAFAVVKLVSGAPAQSPAPTTTTPSVATTTTTEAPRHHGGGGGGGGAPTETVTETAPPPSNSPTTTEPPSTVTVSPSTETSTLTQTVTEPPRRGPFGGR